MQAAQAAGLASSGWRADPAPAGWTGPPRIATRTLGTDAGSVRAARDFTLATLHRWGTAERGHDIAVVVSELVTSALRHALLISGDTRPGQQPPRLGLLQLGPSLLCAVAGPGPAAVVPRRPGFRAETGRGLHTICTLSDKWGYTTAPGHTGKVAWALFTPTASTAFHRPVPGQASQRPVRGATR